MSASPALTAPDLLQERHHTKVQYQLKSEHISLAQVFSKMEHVVGVLGIEDYSVSQTTLDNVSVLRAVRGALLDLPAPLTHQWPTHPSTGVCELCQEAK